MLEGVTKNTVSTFMNYLLLKISPSEIKGMHQTAPPVCIGDKSLSLTLGLEIAQGHGVAMGGGR